MFHIWLDSPCRHSVPHPEAWGPGRAVLRWPCLFHMATPLLTRFYIILQLNPDLNFFLHWVCVFAFPSHQLINIWNAAMFILINLKNVDQNRIHLFLSNWTEQIKIPVISSADKRWGKVSSSKLLVWNGMELSLQSCPTL